MIEGDKIFGVPLVWILFTTFFFCTLVTLIFGSEILADGRVQMIIFLATTAVILTVGHFGWQILLMPASVILLATAWALWRQFK